jgi:hypothetical protein
LYQFTFGDGHPPGFANQGAIDEVLAAVEQREDSGKDIVVESIV